MVSNCTMGLAVFVTLAVLSLAITSIVNKLVTPNQISLCKSFIFPALFLFQARTLYHLPTREQVS